MSNVQPKADYQSLEKHLNFLTPTTKVIKDTAIFRGKIWTRLDQLALLWQRIKILFQTGKHYNNAATLKLLDKNIAIITKDLSALKKSITEETPLNTKEILLNQKRLHEIKEACHTLNHSSVNKKELTKIATFENKLKSLEALLALDPMQQLMHAKHKLLKNSQKAIEEHRSKDGYDADAYATVMEVAATLNSADKAQNIPGLTFSYTAHEAQGRRPSMEDAHFCLAIEQGILTGLFDGHGGKNVAGYANAAFQDRFSQALKAAKGGVRQAFEALINEIHDEVASTPAWQHMGSTAVVCFIDKHTNMVYTATLGDSEANIYRQIKGQLKSIPLSCVRDWSSQKDAKRAADAKNDPTIALEWPKATDPKRLRYPHRHYGINVSRAIGDVGANIHEKPGIIHKPKITVNMLLPGDKLILACDGLKDYVPERAIITVLAKAKPANIAKALVSYALHQGQSHDNVTVLSLSVSA